MRLERWKCRVQRNVAADEKRKLRHFSLANWLREIILGSFVETSPATPCSTPASLSRLKLQNDLRRYSRVNNMQNIIKANCYFFIMRFDTFFRERLCSVRNLVGHTNTFKHLSSCIHTNTIMKMAFRWCSVRQFQPLSYPSRFLKVEIRDQSRET